MIEYKIGDIITEDAEALVNTVNCVGIMGGGVAPQFKNAFPTTVLPTTKHAKWVRLSLVECL